MHVAARRRTREVLLRRANVLRGGGSAALVFVLGVVGAAACADGAAPPYDDLELRDALRADPEVVASLPPEMRQRLGDRLVAAASATDEDRVDDVAPAAMSGAEIAQAIDGARRERKADARVAAVIAEEAHAVVARTPNADAAGDVLPALEGERAGETTRDLEASALAGDGGAALASLLQDAHAHHLVRVKNWPVGLVAIEDTVYVNAAWLVAMGSRGGSEGHGAPPIAIVPAEAHPRTLRGNPYATYGTVGACIDDVNARCSACLGSGACDAAASLTDMSDARTECDFLGKDPKRAQELCILALTSISSVAECVKQDGCVPPSGANVSGSLPNADPFLARDGCVRSLDLCLSGVNEPLDGGARGIDLNVRVEGCQDPFKSCTSAINGCSNACSSGKCAPHGGESCSSCKGCSSCSGCSSDTRTGSGTGYGSQGTNTPPPSNTVSSSSSSGSSGAAAGGASGSGSSSTASTGSAAGGARPWPFWTAASSAVRVPESASTWWGFSSAPSARRGSSSLSTRSSPSSSA